MTFTPEWQRARMHPSWARWLPCMAHLLRLVPHPERFPRRAWDELPELDWGAPAWCDPGDPDDWVSRAADDAPEAEREYVAQHAREHYDQAVKLRGERIDQFNAMCRRAGAAPPATVGQLLECLADLGLYQRHDVDGEQWMTPLLWRNPVDVLPFSAEEAASEASAQHHERALLAAAGLRRLVLAEHTPVEDAEAVEVAVTMREVARHAEIEPGQVRYALVLLAGEDMVSTDTDIDGTDLDSPIALRLPWNRFERFFDFEDLPAPEHFH